MHFNVHRTCESKQIKALWANYWIIQWYKLGQMESQGPWLIKQKSCGWSCIKLISRYKLYVNWFCFVDCIRDQQKKLDKVFKSYFNNLRFTSWATLDSYSASRWPSWRCWVSILGMSVTVIGGLWYLNIMLILVEHPIDTSWLSWGWCWPSCRLWVTIHGMVEEWWITLRWMCHLELILMTQKYAILGYYITSADIAKLS